ncbi:Spy/CpxP family protein refolding chaperone [Sphingomonas vulcanisoli]|uniref:Spy/CpxP family protein refolding chaperone n=1 Tax=Sphingomonas vulcanisoli TaxID=1658060 RepID=A0ABX0TUB1_9SPHN|nr:membrane lipoprotein lipid attachment site-containing protein [Sphingomonas vulcanisoli]NIJ07905.1 Spy/CpxP family protein refolding chaperone [Sphingomonas vulcanisoli]
MKKIILTATAALMLAGAASAQYAPPPPPPGAAYAPHAWDRDAFWRGAPESPRARIDFLQDRISRGAADGSLSRREAARANRELNNIRSWIRRMHWQDDGRLTPDQRAQVQDRLDWLSGQIRWMRHNGW